MISPTGSNAPDYPLPATHPPLGVAPGIRTIWAGAYLFCVFAIWSVLGRYWGIQHDALGYMLQAAAQLNPDPLAGDIFMRYRSQEEFTAFPQLSALAIDWLGIDRAASLLTFLFLVAWVLAAVLLLRRLQGPELTWLSIALLLMIPGWYSAGAVFRYAEPFLTARALAEALSLGALAAFLGSRRVLAAVLSAVALTIHPLMAFPVVLLLVTLSLPVFNWRRMSLFTILLIAAATVGSYLVARPEPLMQGEWLEITRWRSGFLFVGDWVPRDREVAAQTLLTLAIAALVLPIYEARKVVAAALVVGIAGLALALISSEFLPLKFLLQGQPWRWLWIGRFLATAVLPMALLSLWGAGTAARASALLLACAWLLTDAGSFRDVPPIGIGGLLCLLALGIWLVRTRLSARIARLTYGLSWGIVIIVALTFASIVLVAVRNDFSFGRDPFWVQRVTDVLYTPGIAAAIVTSVWYGAIVAGRSAGAIALSVAAVALLIGSAPETARGWFQTPYGEEQRAKFLDWRGHIAKDAEVLWHEAPQAVWFLLERKSFLTVSQAAGTVFSEETTDEIARRAEALAALVSPGVWYLNPTTRREEFHDLTPEILQSICSEPSLGFVVSRFDVGTSVASAEWPSKGDFVYLYDCRKEREEGAP